MIPTARVVSLEVLGQSAGHFEDAVRCAADKLKGEGKVKLVQILPVVDRNAATTYLGVFNCRKEGP